MTNQEKTQAVLEAVRNTEGLEHLKELSFGCEVKRFKNTPKEFYVGEHDTYGLIYRETGETYRDRDFKIIGHPVQWSDVLVAIHVYRPGMTFAGAGEIIEWNGEEEVNEAEVNTFGLHIALTKNPEQNMLENPELLNFLYELLVTK